MALVLVEGAAGEEVGFGLGALSSGLQNKNLATKKVKKYILNFLVAAFGLSAQCGAGSGGLALKVSWLGS